MATMDPSLIQDPREQKWVGEISEILHHQLDIDFETPSLSIFHVPETITTQKPESYEPQVIGLGPNHHFRPLPYKKMEQKKLASLRRVLKHHQIKDFKTSIVDKIQKIVPVVRACYDIFLQDDDISLAWIFAIDGLFLLNIFITCNSEIRESDDYSSHSEIEGSSAQSLRDHLKLDPTKRMLAQDIMMAENQIPFRVLEGIHSALNLTQTITLTPSIYRSFCEIHSPLELCSSSEAPTHVEHVLDYMYNSIVKVPTEAFPIPIHDIEASTSMPRPPTIGLFFLVPDSIDHAVDFAKKVTRKEIVQLYEQTITTLQNFSKNKIYIPSASQLLCKAEFSFQPLQKHEGIQKIRLDEKIFYLPCITLNNDSEVILRNLIAYEMLMPKSNHFPLTEYVGLMCGLILKVDDARILKEKKIIKGDLGENEVAKLFVGMRSSILRKKTNEKSELQELIEKIQNLYESKLRMKATSLFLQKLAQWLLVVLMAIGSFVGATWKNVAFIISIATVFILTYKAYCDVFGCYKTNVTLSYASS